MTRKIGKSSVFPGCVSYSPVYYTNEHYLLIWHIFCSLSMKWCNVLVSIVLWFLLQFAMSTGADGQVTDNKASPSLTCLVQVKSAYADRLVKMPMPQFPVNNCLDDCCFDDNNPMRVVFVFVFLTGWSREISKLLYRWAPQLRIHNLDTNRGHCCSFIFCCLPVRSLRFGGFNGLGKV